MCGVFGYVTDRDEALGPILVEAAQRLTYRGYDSVGPTHRSAPGRCRTYDPSGRPGSYRRRYPPSERSPDWVRRWAAAASGS